MISKSTSYKTPVDKIRGFVLSGSGASVTGAVCDGVTRLLFRAKVSSSEQVTFSLGQNANTSETGTLRSILPTDNQNGQPQNANTVVVNPVTASDGNQYVFAVYQAPANFVRSGQSADLTTSERTVSLSVTGSDGSTAAQDIKLDRPPVVLVHGLWSDPKMWTGGKDGTGYDFRTQLAASLEKIRIFKPDYKTTNAASFNSNKEVIKKAIAQARTNLKSLGYAMVQADLVGHSMGGLLARQWTEDSGYLNQKNFEIGDIHKLITLDTPNKGSFLADAGIACLNGSHSIEATGIFNTMNATGYSLTQGAVADLMTKSPAIANINSNPTNAFVHAIVGNYTNYSITGNTDVLNKPIGLQQISGLPGNYFNLQNILEQEAYSYNQPTYATIPYIIKGSDLVVSNDSQQAGLASSSSYTALGQDHMNVATPDVLAEVVTLLNASDNSDMFSLGI
jgi:pimeloyl-ACP methyl ester carboxylesterase